MKRFSLNLIATFLAFAAGLATATSWSRRPPRFESQAMELRNFCPPAPVQAPLPVPPVPSVAVESAPADFTFAQGHLRLVPEQVHLKSESLRYDIDVYYPQIVGTDERLPIRSVNQHLKDLATKKYHWPLNASKAELDYARENHPGVFNTVTVTYDVGVATDSFLSIHFIGYSFAAGARNSVQENSTVNYDLVSGRPLKLSELFKPGSKYLEFLSLYCEDEIARNVGKAPSKNAIAARADNFDSWQINSHGITFNFDACKLFDCEVGDQTVDIPFSELKAFLNPGIPGRFKITYP